MFQFIAVKLQLVQELPNSGVEGDALGRPPAFSPLVFALGHVSRYASSLAKGDPPAVESPLPNASRGRLYGTAVARVLSMRVHTEVGWVAIATANGENSPRYVGQSAVFVRRAPTLRGGPVCWAIVNTSQYQVSPISWRSFPQ